METPSTLTGFKLSTSPFFIEERMSQINLLLERNFYMIGDLEKRISNLMDLNEKISKELYSTNKVAAKPAACLL